jgi:uncharacterized iron-regulated membrane protein
MSVDTPMPGSGAAAPPADPASARRPRRPDPDRTARGRFLRRVWRLHFYAGMIAGPVLLLLSLTGLVILYTDPIQSVLHRDLYSVTERATTVDLDRQVASALSSVGDGAEVVSVTPPPAADRSTRVDVLREGGDTARSVYVDPYTGDVLGSMTEGDDVVGLANRLHGFLNNDAVTVPLPSLAHLVDPTNHPSAVVDIPLGSLVIEIVTVWTLVLAISGIFLWWPRRSERGKRLFSVRWSKGGRVRWRDLHAVSGVGLVGILVAFVVSGMPWSDYWGEDWRAVASTVTPSAEPEYTSSPVTIGELDRFGKQIVWSDRDRAVAQSDPGNTADATSLDWDSIARIGREEAMIPGYSIFPPAASSEGGSVNLGTVTLVNRWPQRLDEQRTVFLDRFTGRTLGETTAADSGILSRATDFGVNMHMGTQYGVVTRVAATLGCLLVVASLVTSYAMWWRRRPTGSAGLPRVPARRDTGRTRGSIGLVVIGVLLALAYPSFGMSVVAIVVLDTLRQTWSARRRRRVAGEAVG